jgi:CheY-like chemotaxis protein/HPt (histidine-containing phosphotransfer) domain-containing protein
MKQTPAVADQLNTALPDRYPMNILLVEDNLINRHLVLRMLKELGYQADIAENGALAVEAVSRTTYDLLFMDVQMPEMDGFESTKRIRQLSGSDEVPTIIAMTANALEGDQQKCLTAGMNDYISKPIRLDTLHNVIAHWGPVIVHRHGKPGRVKPQHPSTEPVIGNRLEGLLREMGVDFVMELVDLFLAEAPMRLKMLEREVEAVNMEQIRYIAHALKGSSRNIGAEDLGTIAGEIEQEATVENLDEIKEKTLLLRERFGQTIEQYEQFKRTAKSRTNSGP